MANYLKTETRIRNSKLKRGLPVGYSSHGGPREETGARNGAWQAESCVRMGTNDRRVVLPQELITAALNSPASSGPIPLAAGVASNVFGGLCEPTPGVPGMLWLYCSEGQVWCEAGGCRRRVCAGELLLVSSSVSCITGAAATEKWVVSWVRVAGRDAALLPGRHEQAVEGSRLAVGQDQELGALFEELLQAMEAGGVELCLERAAQLLARLFSAIAWRCWQDMSHDTETSCKIKRSIRYMRQHLDQPLQVAKLAALVNVSPSHYFALFKRHTGFAPIDFFIRLRMQQACRMLEITSCNVKEVAAALGYDDPFYFSRLFKSVNHIAPSEYRGLSEGQKHVVRDAGLPKDCRLGWINSGADGSRPAASTKPAGAVDCDTMAA